MVQRIYTVAYRNVIPALADDGTTVKGYGRWSMNQVDEFFDTREGAQVSCDRANKAYGGIQQYAVVCIECPED